jgi:hypothetical protein
LAGSLSFGIDNSAVIDKCGFSGVLLGVASIMALKYVYENPMLEKIQVHNAAILGYK